MYCLKGTNFCGLRRTYQPYEGRDHPRFANINDSVTKSPLEENYSKHINHAKRIRKNIMQRRGTIAERFLLSDIQRKEWFIRIERDFLDCISNLEYGLITGQKVIVSLAVLEFYCSLIIFSDHANYRRLTEEDVLGLRIPLSKRSRGILCRGKIKESKFREDGSKIDLDALTFSLFPY
jgi:hypothetical protein